MRMRTRSLPVAPPQMWFCSCQYTTEDTQVHVNFEKTSHDFFPNRTAENTPFIFTM